MIIRLFEKVHINAATTPSAMAGVFIARAALMVERARRVEWHLGVSL